MTCMSKRSKLGRHVSGAAATFPATSVSNARWFAAVRVLGSGPAAQEPRALAAARNATTRTSVSRPDVGDELAERAAAHGDMRGRIDHLRDLATAQAGASEIPGQ